MKTVLVKSPATSANLGCGFDSFGCAHSLYNKVWFTVGNGQITFEGVEEKYQNEDNLAVTAFNKTLKKLGCELSLSNVKIEADIPIARGLGSSSSLIAAGCIAANAFCEDRLSKKELVEIATEIEGHPDNVAPCILGGLTSSCISENEIVSVPFPINEKLRFILIIPPYELSTALSRGVLPREVKFSDAVHNLSRIAPLINGFINADEVSLKFGMDDVLHQPYREKLIPDYSFAKEVSLHNGAVAFCLSGAGPTMLALAKSDEVFGKIRSVLEEKNLTVLNLCPDYVGATYEIVK